MTDQPSIIDFKHGISAIDVEHVRPQLAASHLIVQDGKAAFVDVGTSLGSPLLMQTLAQKNIKPEDVEYVILTHIHLDHAGGAGTMMAQLPNAQLVVHPRGAWHMANPSKLIAGATAVYGEAEMKRLHGDINPVEAERIIESPDGFTLTLGGRILAFFDTPGHARHHCCIYDEASRGMFSGDSFGLSYRELDTRRGAFILPTTSPVQFDPEAAHGSIDRLMGENPSAMYLTHFSRVDDLSRLADLLHLQLEKYVEVAVLLEGVKDQRAAKIEAGLFELTNELLDQHGCELSPSQRQSVLALDLDLNAQGLDVWLQGR